MRQAAVWGVLCGIVAWSAGSAAGGDWPQWGGTDQRNMVSPERGLIDTFNPGHKNPNGSGVDLASTTNVRWAVRLGSHCYGDPTIADGRVLIGTNDASLRDPRFRKDKGGLLLCLDEHTGKLLWRLHVPRLMTKLRNFNFNDLNLGICSSATIQGDRAYVVTNRCEVLCLDMHGQANGNDGPFRDEGQYMVGPGHKPVPLRPTDGDIIWRYDMIKQADSWPHDAACCSVLVYGNYVYVGTNNGVDRSHVHVMHPLAPSFIVLDKRTGKRVAVDDEKIGTRVFHGQWSSPSLGVVHGQTQIYYGAGDGWVYAFAPYRPGQDDGVLHCIWRYNCNPHRYTYDKNGKRRVYVQGDIRRRRREKGFHEPPNFLYVGPSEIIATPVFYHNRVYVATGEDPMHGHGVGMLTCIDATRTGDISADGAVWTYDKIERSLSTVSISNGLLYVADTFGHLHCLDADTGKVYWTYNTHSKVWSSTLVADGKIYLGIEKGVLLVLTAGRKPPKVISHVRLGAAISTTPVAANGTLYVATQRFLYALSRHAGHGGT